MVQASKPGAPNTRLVAALLFGSGLAALVYQTAWQRMLKLVFGASTAASAAVLGIFLGGLGLGGAWLSARAERHPKPLFLYGNFELGVALAAALSPLLLELAGAVYFRLGGSGTLGWFGATLVRLVLAVLVMGPAVVLMGGTLPAAARAVESDDDAARGRLAILYAVNTSGAVVGALLGTFLLFELLGVRLSLWAACLINALVAVLARGVGRGAEPVPVREASKSEPVEPGILAPRLVYALAGVVGFAFLYLELLWYRMLSPLLGGSSFTFGLVLSVTLAGIGLGGFLYSRRDERKEATASLLAGTLALEALTVAFPIALGDKLAIFAAHAREMASLGFGALVVSWTLVTLVVVFPAAFVSGYQFPVLFALLGRGRQGVARHVGLTYAFNTIGSILGAIVGGLVLLPRLGAVSSWRAIAMLLAIAALGVAVLATLREARAGKGRWRTAGAVLAALVGLLFARAEGPTAAWRHRPIGAGRVNLSNFNRNDLEAWRRLSRSGMLWQRDGLESSVALSSDNGFAFIVNGKSDGSVLLDRATMGFTALLPALMHPSPKSVFVIGLGTGMSAGWVARAPGVERVDVAELEPAIVDVARAAAVANFDVVNLPNVRLFLGDGREFLLTSKRRYDIVASEPSNPYRAGIASLLTREFYLAIEEHLNPGGIFVQWIQTYEIDALTLRVVLRTLREVFPFVEAWQTEWGDMLLIATREKQVYDADAIRRRIQIEPYKAALRQLWLVDDVEGVLSHFLANHELVATLSDPANTPLNTDDQNLLEYAFARRMEDADYDPMLEMLTLAISKNADRPELRGSVDWTRVSELRPRAQNISGISGAKLPVADANANWRRQAVDAGCLGRLDGVLDLWNKQPRAEPLDSLEVFVLALGAARAKDETRALELASRLEQLHLVAEAELVRARLRSDQNQPALAAEAGLRGLRELQRAPFPFCDTARNTIFLLEHSSGGDKQRARTAALALLEAPLAGHVQDRGRQEAAFRLSTVTGDPELCTRALGPLLKDPIWDLRFLANRFVCLERAHHPEARQARADFETFLINTPARFGDALNEAVTPEKLLQEAAPALAESLPANKARDALRR